MPFLQGVLTVLFVLSAGTKLAELVVRRRERVSAGLLAASFALLALGLWLSGPPLKAVNAAVAGLGNVVYNGSTVLGLYLMVVFFLRALHGPDARPRIRRETAAVLATLAAFVVLMLLTPVGLRSHSLFSPYIGYPPVLAFYLVGGAYFIHSYLAVMRLTWTYVRAGRGPLAWALRLIAAGLAGLTITSLVRIGRVLEIVLIGDQLTTVNAVNFRINLLSHLVVAVGLVLAGWAQALVLHRIRRDRRRQFHALEPLWTVLTGIYPEIVLRDAADRRAWRRLLPASWNNALYRRVLECRDGLLRSGPLIAGAAGTDDLSALPPQAVADHLHDIAARPQPPQPSDPADPAPGPVAVATPAGADLGCDVDALLAISDALPALAGDRG